MRLRVLTADASTPSMPCDGRLRERIQATVREVARRRRRTPSEPNLEDVFVAVTHDAPRTRRARGMNWRRLWAIVLKELRQMRRDRITLAMILGIPVMQLILFGYAINFNLRGLDAGIADQANTAASRALVMDMLATGVVDTAPSARTRPSN